MADGSSSLPPRRLADDDDLEEGQFVPAAYQSSSDTDDYQAPAPAPPPQHARRPRHLSMGDVLALGRGDALPSPTPASSCESDGTISADGVPSPASVFRMEPKRKRVVVALDGSWAATGKRGWAGGKPAAAAPLNNPQSSNHSNVSGDSSSSTPPPEAAAQLPQLVVPQRADHQPPRRVYTCKECGRTFTTNQALGGHAAGHRSRQREAEAAAAAAGMMPAGVDAAAFLAALRRSRREEAPHECRKCHKVFATGVALGGHMRVHYTGPPIVPTRKNKKRCLALALQPEEDIAAAAAPTPPGLSLALSIKAEEAPPSSPAPAGGVRVVRLFGIDISPQVQAPSEQQQCSGTTTTGDCSSAGGQQ
ncbi:zinc finger protein GLI4-like [Setaria italica]|uniref:zinc finger protein GLI4-like n=1 Tax=Setaria italica TaxID=4555 RepID=UPI000BE5EFB5|nr:zinc finger protein GLI4-like [Setaria italica]